MFNKPNFDEASKIAEINLHFHDQVLPVLANIRDEEQHALALINGIIDKALDLGKLLVGVSFPALIALYSLENDKFNANTYIVLTFGLFIVGILIFIGGLRYKFVNLSTYVDSSAARLKSYTEMLTTARLNAQNEDNKLAWTKIRKKKV